MKAISLKQLSLLRMKQKSLEKRFFDYYKATGDAVYVIQAAVMVMVRNFSQSRICHS